MSRLMAAFLWCLLALFTGAAGVIMILGGFWDLGTPFLLFAAFAGRAIRGVLTAPVTKAIEKMRGK